MARFLKNPQLAPGATGAILPIVPGTGYGDAPVSGLIRFNQATSRIEFFYNGAWSQVAKIGSVQLVVDTFSGDGVTTTFTMTQPEIDPTAIAVFIGGVYQMPTTHYTVGGYTITFNSAPPQYTGASPTTITVIHNINSTNVAA